MTKGQIQTYEYCKKHLERIANWKGKLPIEKQQYGCGSGAPNIEHMLENIHIEMYNEIYAAMQDASLKIQKIIDEA